MGCPDENTLVRLLTGKLEAGQRSRLDDHVDGCSACQALITALAQTVKPPPSEEASDNSNNEGARTPLAVGERVDHFQVTRLEGWGGMGEVYLARDTRLGRKVALKVLTPTMIRSPEEMERLLAEAKTTARFSHPNIVTIHHVGTHRGQPYLALEYLGGQNLRQRLQQARPGPREALRLMLALARAVREAHRHDVLHGDLKPENVLIPADGRPRVVDFGLARTATEADDETPGNGGLVGGTPAYMAPELLAGHAGPTTSSDVWALGLVMRELATGEGPDSKRRDSKRPPAAAEPPPEVPGQLGDLIEACLREDPQARPTAGGVVEQLEPLLDTRRDELPDDESPFRGLISFSEQQARLFFGRDDEIAAFIERLREEPVLPVVGPSGVGKSSFVKAGVIPRLREQGRWTVLSLRPSHRPFQALASRLAETGTPDAQRRESELVASPELLSLQLQQLAADRSSRVLLFVDQFEEVLTQVAEDERRRFIRAVCSAADDPFDPVRVVFTLREDVLGQLAREPAARQVLGRVTVLTPPAPPALGEILTRPAEVAGYHYDDPDLVQEMVAEVQDEVACLPLIQFAGQRLWEHRDRKKRLLRRADYQAIGGVAGALARHADSVVGALSLAEVEVGRALLLRLVTPEGMRRVLPRAELLDGLPSGAGEVLARLTEARLVTIRQGEGAAAELELVHEALVSTWARLGRWLDEEHEELRLLADVDQAAELWERRGRKDEELWSGAALHDARRMIQRSATTPERAARFIAASRRRQRRRTLWRRGLIAAAFVALALVALAFAAKERETGRQKRLAEQRRAEVQRASARAALTRGDLLEARAELRASLEVDDSALGRVLWHELSLQPLQWKRTLADDVFALDATMGGETLAVGSGDRAIYLVDAATGRTRHILRGHRDQIEAVTFSPDGRRLASASLDGEIRLWQLATRSGEVLSPASSGGRSGIDRRGNVLAFSPDGRTLVAGDRAGAIGLWEIGKQTRRVLGNHGAAVYAAVFSPDGKRLATAGGDGKVLIWQVANGRVAHRLEGHTAAVHAVAYSADGALIAAGGIDKTASIWDARSGARKHRIRGEDTVQSLAFSQDGALLALGGSWDHGVRLVDARTGVVRRVLAGHAALVTGVRFLANGARLVSASMDRTVRLWSVKQARSKPPLTGHGARVYGASFSPDGKHLATASEDWTARIWEVKTGRPTRVLRHPGVVYTTRYSPDGKLLATSTNDKTVRLWDPATGREVARLAGHAAPVLGLDFSPDGAYLATGSVDQTVGIWAVATGKQVRRMTGHTGRIFDLAYGPDGRRLATVSLDGSLRIWEASSGRTLRVMSIEGAGALFGVAFSPDGEHVATAGADRTVRLWDPVTGAARVIGRHPGRAYHLAFHPNGQRLGVPGADGTARIWGREGKHTALRGHRGEVNFLRFSPDGAFAATTGDDGTVRLWDAASGRPDWRSVALLGRPPRLLTGQGWVALDPAKSSTPASGRAWRAASGAQAQLAAIDQQARALCLITRDDQLELWDLLQDRRLLRRPAPSTKRLLAAPDGCLVLRQGNAEFISRGGKNLRLARGVTAVSVDRDGVLVAAGRRALSFTPRGRQLDALPAGEGATAIARTTEWVVLGFSDGKIERIPRRTDPQRKAIASLSHTSTGVARLLPGPRQTVIAGHTDGTLGIWDLSTGELLKKTRLNGRMTQLLIEDAKLFAASELGDHVVWELGHLQADYCALLKTVWSSVTVGWRAGHAEVREPPAGHPCLSTN